MFEHLRALVVQSSNRYLTWQQTADFSFAGETIGCRLRSTYRSTATT